MSRVLPGHVAAACYYHEIYKSYARDWTLVKGNLIEQPFLTVNHSQAFIAISLLVFKLRICMWFKVNYCSSWGRESWIGKMRLADGVSVIVEDIFEP